eukprot:756356-Hanusia_phi.AAC.4
MDGEGGLEGGEAEEGRARAGRDELEQSGLVSARQPRDYLPEPPARAVQRRVAPRVHDMRLEVFDVEASVVLPADEDLQLERVEEPDPLDADHVLEAAEEGVALPLDLLVEPVVGHEVDVLDLVGGGDFDVGAPGNELVHLSSSRLVYCDGEVQRQVPHVPLVVLEVHQVLVERRVERRELVKVVVLAQELGQEEAAEGEVHLDPVVHSLAEHPPEKRKVLEVGMDKEVAVGVGEELLLGGELEETVVGVERALDEVGQELLVQPSHVDARLVEPTLVDKEHFDYTLELLPQHPELVEAVLHNTLPPDLDKRRRPLLTLLLLLDQPLEDLDPLAQGDDMRELAEHDEGLTVVCGGVDAEGVHFETLLQPDGRSEEGRRTGTRDSEGREGEWRKARDMD